MTAAIFLGVLLFGILLVVIVSRSTTRDETQSSAPQPPERVSDREQPHAVRLRDANLCDLLPRSFVVLDLETTGLSAERDQIIEIGAIRVVLDADEHATFQTLVRPTCRVPAKITAITGITQAMVDADGVTIANALAQLINFIGDLPLVTFNADFDMSFLWTAARRSGIAIENSYTCALKRARRAWPGLPSYRLSELARLGNLSCEDSHRALGDCQRALVVFVSATSTLGQKVRWSRPLSFAGQ